MESSLAAVHSRDRRLSATRLVAASVTAVAAVVVTAAVAMLGGRSPEPIAPSVTTESHLVGSFSADVTEPSALRGRWTVTFHGNGTMEVRAPVSYTGVLSRTLFSADPHTMRNNLFAQDLCSGTKTPTYRWRSTADGVAFSVVSDECPARRLFFANTRWVLSTGTAGRGWLRVRPTPRRQPCRSSPATCASDSSPLTGHAPTRVIDTGCDWDTDLCAADIEPTWTPSGKRIVFTRVTGPFDDESGDAASALLFSTKLDGSHLRRVSPDHMPPTAEDNVARFTPDGRHIVFIRDKYVDGDLHYAAYRMRRDGTAVTRLTPWALDADRATPSPATYGPGAGLIAFETHGGWNPGRGDVALIPVGCRSVKSCMAQHPLRHPQQRWPQEQLRRDVVSQWTSPRVRGGAGHQREGRRVDEPVGRVAPTPGHPHGS